MIKARQHGGKTCPHLDEEKLCNKHACAIDCEMSDYGSWSTCSLSCGGGTQTATAICYRYASMSPVQALYMNQETLGQ